MNANRRQTEYSVSDAKFQALVEQMPAVIYQDSADDPYQAIYISPQMFNLLGYTPEEFISDQGLWDRLIHPEDRDRYLREEKAHHVSGNPLNIDYRMLDKAGNIHWIHDEGVIVYDPSGNPLFSQGILMDINLRRQVDAELKQLRKAVKTSQDAIFITDPEGVIQYINPAFTHLYGFTEEEIVYKTTPRILKSGILTDEAYVQFWNNIQTKDTFNTEITNKTKDGKLVFVESSVSPILDDQRNLSGYLAIQRDITEQTMMKNAFQESEDRYRDLVEHSHDLMTIHDLDGKILSVNASAAVKMGYRPDELVGKNLRDFIPQESLRETELYLKLIKKRGKAKGLLRILPPNGEPQVWEYDNTLRTSGVQDPVVRGIAHDVTAQINAERNLHRRIQELTVLHAVSQAGVECTTEDELIERSTQVIGDALHLDNFGVMKMDEDLGELKNHSSYREREGIEIQAIKMGEGITGLVAQDRLPRRIADVSQDPNYIPADPHTRSELCVPLQLGDKLIGVINAESKRLNAFSESDEQLLVTFSLQLASAIQNLRMAEALQIHANRQTFLYKLSQDLVSEDDEEEICRLAVNAVHKMFDYRNVGIYLKDPETSNWRWISCQGIREIYLGEQIFHDSEELNRSDDYKKSAEQGLDQLSADGSSNSADGNPYKLAISIKNEPQGWLVIHHDEKKRTLQDEQPVLIAVVNQIAGAIDRCRLFSQIQQMATTDALTGLRNRHYFYEHGELEFEHADRYSEPISAIMFDIDHFKRINDQYGHSTGDQVLTNIASRSNDAVRKVDLLARYGGDEFVILLPKTDAKGAREIVERLRRAIASQPVPTDKGNFDVSISAGVSTGPDTFKDMADLIECADNALYQAKHAGRNRVEVYQPDLSWGS